jgi:integrase
LLRKPKATGTGTLSKTTVQRVHATLHWALEELVDEGSLHKNPAHKAKPEAKKSERTEIHFWMPDKLDTFLADIRSHRLYALWHLYAWTGIRRGEGAALRVRDIDLDAGTVTISRAITVASYQTHVSTPKSGKTRLLDLDPDTVAIVRAHLRRMNEESLQRGAGRLSDDDLLFVGEDGSPIHPERISKMFDAHLRRINRTRERHAKLPVIRLHDLRHTHASHLIAAGVNVKVIQERLGHASITVTLDVYGHLFPRSQREAVDKLAAFYQAQAV